VTDVQLSVVAAGSGAVPVAAHLQELRRACEGVATEFLFIIAGDRPSEQAAAGDLPVDVRIAHRPAGTLTPVLWGAGLEAARGPIVAFTTDQLRPAPGWAQTLLRAVATGAVGAGGPIALDPQADAATAAAWFLRYSAFGPEVWPHSRLAQDVPGDNAAYRRDAVLRHADLVREGFWEVEFHRRFAIDKLELRMEPGAAATLVGPVPFGNLLRQRFIHGRVFGRARVERHGETRLRLLLAMPFVPIVLVARSWKRARATPSLRAPFWGALPWLAGLATAWAAGEGAGALGAGGSGHR
jgi:hypothetical protein